MPSPPDPILIDVPESFTTERLLVRCPKPGDGPTVCAAVIESRERLMPWLPWAHKEPTPENYEIIARRGNINYLERSDLRMPFYRLDNGDFVGSSGLHRIDWNVPKFEIGYWVRTKYEGQGYVTEAVNGIANFAFEVLNARRVEIRCSPANTRSAAVAERCGFTLETRIQNDKREESGLRDTLVFVRLK